jgi:hypothetical protein
MYFCNWHILNIIYLTWQCLEGSCVAYVMTWHMYQKCLWFGADMQFFFLFFLSLLLEFNVNPLKISNQPLQFFFPSHLVHVFWITILFYFEWAINYKSFSISFPFIFFNLSNMVLNLLITIFFLISYKINPLLFFNLSNLVLIILITIYFI